MPDVTSVAAQVDALSNLVANLQSERDSLKAERDTLQQQNADLATQLADAQAAAVDPTLLNSVSDKLGAMITSLTPAPPA